MKKALIVLILIIIGFGAFFLYYWQAPNRENQKSGSSRIQQKPLEKYTIENLSKTQFTPSEITLGEIIKDEPQYASKLFFFSVNGKKVSGLINLPKTPGTYPVIVMFRGYVDKEIYQTGVGTQRAGEVFAQNGYITLAPDFLGYSQSDNAPESSIEERLLTYTTALTLLRSIVNLNQALSAEHLDLKADPLQIGIWGHSNGGQIALTVLETSGTSYPTVLWAPVSKPFPYSILYYTDDFDDRGKALRRVVADFEKDYDVELFSLPNYLDKIQAPIQLHQGTADDAVPLKWSDLLFAELKKLDKDVTYFTYPGGDHNLLGGWQLAVNRSIAFYKEKLK